MTFLKHNIRWVAAGFLLTLCSSFGQTFFISIWSAEIRSEFGLTHGGFGGIYLLATLGSAATLPYIGKLIDRMSIRSFAIGTIIMLTIGTLMMAFSTGLVALVLSIYLLRLFGQGLMTHTAMTAMGRWFVATRGRAVSLATIGHQAGEAILPTLFVALAVTMSWRETWIVAAVLLAVLALPALLLLVRAERIPEGSEGVQLATGRQWTRGEVLRDPLFWMIGLGVMVPPFTGTSIFFHQNYLIEINGWEPAVYYASFAAMAVMTSIFAILAGFAVDRFGATRLLPHFLVPLGAACLVLGTFGAEWAAAVFMILLGISYGISSTLFGALWPEVYGTKHLGAIRSTIVALMVFCTAAGPGLTGWLIDNGVPFKLQLQYIGAYCFAMVCLLTVAGAKLRARSASIPA